VFHAEHRANCQAFGNTVTVRFMTATTLEVLDHPLIQHKLMRIRNVDTPPEVFRSLVSQVAGLMVFQISRDLAVCDVQVNTPLETTSCSRLVGPITIVPILRAGIGMADGITHLMPEARTGHIGLYRNEKTLEPVEYYCKLPQDIADGPVFLVDPMLATGGSAIAAVKLLQRRGCHDIRLVCLVASPEGAAAMAAQCPDVSVCTAALDRQLNDVGYILPGLGDAGDRIFGTR
jgi:uracil phosphoribosyltransferase